MCYRTVKTRSNVLMFNLHIVSESTNLWTRNTKYISLSNNYRLDVSCPFNAITVKLGNEHKFKKYLTQLSRSIVFL